jgi:cell division protein FtsL
MRKRRPRQVKSKVYNYQVANRRKHSGSSRWIPGVIVLVLVAVATGIVYVWQHNRLLNMGYTVNRLRGEIAQIKEDRIKLDAEVFKLKTPDRILHEVELRQLGLRRAQAGQVIHLEDPPPLVSAEDSDVPQRPAGRKLWDTIVLGER